MAGLRHGDGGQIQSDLAPPHQPQEPYSPAAEHGPCPNGLSASQRWGGQFPEAQRVLDLAPFDGLHSARRVTMARLQFERRRSWLVVGVDVVSDRRAACRQERARMTSNGVELRHLNEPAPVILSVPHGGTRFPRVCRAGLRVPPESLWSDWDTAELYRLTDDLAVPLVTTGLSRFVADPNRAPTPPLHGDFWTTVVPARDPTGARLYDHELTDAELQMRLDLAHTPYHEALDSAVKVTLQRHQSALLLDLHSFGMPLEVDAVLGDGNGTTAASAASNRVENALRVAGFTVARNLRFSGGYIVRRWADSERVDAVQIELNQRRYLRDSDVDESIPRPRRRPDGWTQTRRAITAVIRSLCADPDHCPTGVASPGLRTRDMPLPRCVQTVQRTRAHTKTPRLVTVIGGSYLAAAALAALVVMPRPRRNMATAGASGSEISGASQCSAPTTSNTRPITSTASSASNVDLAPHSGKTSMNSGSFCQLVVCRQNG
jgi:N-formylglutamate amidohydrolase